MEAIKLTEKIELIKGKVIEKHLIINMKIIIEIIKIHDIINALRNIYNLE